MADLIVSDINALIIGVNALGVTFAVLALQSSINEGVEIAKTRPRKIRTAEAATEKIRKIMGVFLHVGTLFLSSSVIILWNIFPEWLGFQFPPEYPPAMTFAAYSVLLISYGEFVFSHQSELRRKRSLVVKARALIS